MKSKNFNMSVDKSLDFKSPNAHYCSSPHSKDNSFSRWYVQGLTNWKILLMKFLEKFANLKKDLTPLAMIGLC
jgi:hypothetical protein